MHQNAVALPYVVLSSPLAMRANSCRATRIFLAVRDLRQRRQVATHFRISVFNRSFDFGVDLLSGNPSSPRIVCSQLDISGPGTLVIRPASSSARLGMADLGPSDPADSSSARKICGPKCLMSESAMGSSGDGKRVLAKSATYISPAMIGLTKKDAVVVKENRSCAERPITPRAMYVSTV